MKIHVNGDACELPGPMTVAQLLAHRELAGKQLAVEVNGEVVPRARHAEHRLQENDHLEIVSLVGGG